MSKQSEVVFVAGNFWQVQDMLGNVKGIISTEAGYAGGTTNKPHYHERGDHQEAVRVTYNPRQVLFEELLAWFWRICSDNIKTGKNICGVYYTDEREGKAARAFFKKYLNSNVSLINIEPLASFHAAEDYHQNYFKKLRGEDL